VNISYWEQNAWFDEIDVLIIGSGIVGLNAALHLKTKSPRLKVLILERGMLPSGASTKNAGFACFGSPSELLDDLAKQNEDLVFSLVEKRWKGLLRLRKNLGDKAISYEGLGGYEIFDDDSRFEACESKLAYLNKQLASICHSPNVYQLADKKIAGFGLKKTKHMLVNTAEGQIDTGKMMHALLTKVQSLGVLILNTSAVNTFAEQGKFVEVITGDGLKIRAEKLLFATNGFARQLLPELDVKPARAQVLITAPIKGLKLKGAFHYDRGYYYFRNINNRVLLGGGRNLAFQEEETDHFGLTSKIQNTLDELLRTLILPGKSFEVERRWSGIMGVGEQKTAIVKKISPRIFCAVRMGGMGVAIGSLVGEEAAALLNKNL
jgi:gamma-glutamylputrescine oxidase